MVKSLAHKREDLRLDPSTHGQSQAWRYVNVIPALGRRRQRILGVESESLAELMNCRFSEKNKIKFMPWQC